MAAINLNDRYDHKALEGEMYSLWESGGYFSPQPAPEGGGPDNQGGAEQRPPFVVVIPPPNVTGHLHMGHGLNIALQDIIVRYKRMCGYRTLWVPGTDHAGIATQHVVERKLREEGLSRREIGREKFLERAWQVVREHHAVITKQIRAIGASCDWTREAFTFDEQRSSAVQQAFTQLYKKDMLYRGEYLVNWCSQCRTALSDEEVEHHEIQGNLYTIFYPFDGKSTSGTQETGKDGIIVVTTRPETMLGDEAIAVHPGDKRYSSIVGKSVRLPLTEKDIPIIADTYIDREFGSGALKLTPGHDPNDFEIGKKNNLALFSIIDPDGKLNQHVPEQFQGLTVKEARKAVAAALKEQGYLQEVTPHLHQVGHCYRCGTVIEPLLSEQWFVRMRPMADALLRRWKAGEFTIRPSRWESTFEQWLENIRDWCISRQLWWGHRIPVWYRKDPGAGTSAEITHVGAPPAPEGAPGEAPAGETDTFQDEDVLDTWFSSWLWPFSTLGWPGETEDMRNFYPTSLLVTGYDIIFFWVSRMLMAGMEFTDALPFTDIYLNGLIRDKQGRKMTKSLGNGIDPLGVIEKYGADALKFSLVYLMAGGQDLRLGPDDFSLGSRFCNKIWNAARFIFNLSEQRTLLPKDKCPPTDLDTWFASRLDSAAAALREAFDANRYSEAAHVIYELFWNEFCDWYVECSKTFINIHGLTTAATADLYYSNLVYFFQDILSLLHPFVSFITEKLYQTLLPILKSVPNAPAAPPAALIIAPYYPTAARPAAAPDSPAAAKDAITNFTELQKLVTSIRTIRSEFTIPPKTRCRGTIIVHDSRFSDYLRTMLPFIDTLTATDLHITGKPDANGQTGKDGISLGTPRSEIILHALEHIDVTRQLTKMKKDLASAHKQEKSITARLAPGSPFHTNAPQQAIAAEKQRHSELTDRIEQLERFCTDLEQITP